MARGARAHLDRVLSGHGVTFAGFLVLRGLAAGPVGNGELAARLEIEAPTLTRQVNRLVRAGLVERSVPDGDRRAVRLSLSERGRRLLADVERAVAEGDAELAAPLDADELATLRRLLGRLGAHVDRLGRRWGHDVVSGGPAPSPPRP
ncbi:MarR family transcriptional regulator, transcriptional regulator for hemolysin [Streptoalloteichus hindustanus]|uniref:MarR family transcriptional regulator, transcriptional regulator for hemolysin n=1 Tax=Streptoalloteichus hindustanus TaxID=2017 RepID=A0A1M5JAK2_STRHI|nr:MarR family transcriptional regulator, transcriptional regulator for hemolysin [Streptoalloteichus hindustanus]